MSVDRLANLSYVLQVLIARMLPLPAIGRLARCCTTLRDACAHHSVWVDKLPRAFHRPASRHAPQVDHRRILRRWLECSSVDARAAHAAQLAGLVPGARFLHRSLRLGARMLVFGGKSATEYFDECWSLDLETLQWARLGSDAATRTPEPRCAASLTYVNGCVLIFGGRSQTDRFLADVWRLELVDGTGPTSPPMVRWTQLADAETDGAPAGRWAHGAVAMHGWLVVFGGSNLESTLNDLWLFDPSRHAWVECAGALDDDSGATTREGADGATSWVRPCARGGHSMVCIREDEAVLFGGNDMVSTFSDVWLLRLTATPRSGQAPTTVPRAQWTRLVKASESAPPARVGHAMVAFEDRVVVLGGRNFLQSSFDERAHILDVTTERWHALSSTGDGDATRDMARSMTRTGHSAVEYSGSILVFGGLGLRDVERPPHDQNVFLNDMMWLHLVGSDVDVCTHPDDEPPAVRLVRV